MRAVILGIAAACACAAAPSGPTGGVSGSVSLWPARPGPQRAGEPGSKGYAGASVQLRDARGRVVAHAVTDSQGRFTMPAPAGRYEVSVDAGGKPYPRCQAADATVHDGALTGVELLCDSGMR